MLMRSLVVAAVSAVVLSPLAVQQAIAAGRAMPLDAGHPTPAPIASVSREEMADDDMAGMNHEDMPDTNHEGTPGVDHDEPSEAHPGNTAGMSDQEMPGMDHGSTATSDRSPASPGSAESGGSHAHAEEDAPSGPRPTAALVGAFAAVNAGVMGTAFVLRRRERAKGGERRGRAVK